MAKNMNLTAQDVYSKEFHVDLKGYAPAEVDEFLDQVIEDYQEYDEKIEELSQAVTRYEQKINELLRDDWDFDRLSMLEQAILLISFQEILANDTPKAVVINEAITLAKKYCDDNSYKLLNGVLDQL